MEPWKKINRQTSTLSIALGLVLACGAVSANDLRVKIGQGGQVEIRCAGPIAAVIENRTGEAAELSAGTYILRVVEGPSFYRVEPLVAGIISSPHSPTVASAMSAYPPSESWVVELVRTPSQENAARAEQAARVQIKGKIQVVQRNGEYVTQMGPFPNRYLAQQALQKAQRYGFPARIREMGGVDMLENAVATTPRAYRRLTPKGAGRAMTPPPVETAPEAPPPKGLTIAVPPEPKPDFQPEPNIDLEPLPLFSEEDLALEPLPSEPEEDILVQPFAEPQKEELQPDLGARPAPPAEQKAVAEPIRIRPPDPRRGPRSPQFSQGPPPNQRRPLVPQPRPIQRPGPPPQEPELKPMPQAPMAKAEPRSAPAPQPMAPPQKSARQAPPPQPNQQVGPPPMPEQRSQPAPQQRPQPAPQQPPVTRPPVVEPAPPAVAQAPPPQSTQPQGSQEPRELDRWVPERQPTTGNRVLRSIPFLRKYSWQKPLVEPPRDFATPEDLFSRALQEPARPVEDMGEPVPDTGTIPYAPDIANDLARQAPEEGEFGPPMETPPSISPGDEEALVVPFEEPETAELPKVADSVTSIDDLNFDSSIVPPAPGEERTESAPLFSPGASTEPGETMKSREPTAISGQPRLLNLPATGPVRRAYVQLFNDSGDPVTEPAAHIDIASLTSSRLEHRDRGYNGSFQAYAPTDDQLVLVNVTDVQDYVSGILPEEISPEAPLEVLKAQAILIRGYALKEASQGAYAAYGFDLDGSTEAAWPYLGTDSVSPEIRRAVQETESEILIDTSGTLATPVYCFSSGGYVADAQSVWGGTGEPVPSYLTAKPDFNPADVPEFPDAVSGFASDEDRLEDWLQSTPNTYDRDAAGSYFRWEVRFTDEEMNEIINAYWNGTVGEVRSLKITRRAISGHATEMEVRGSEQTVTARSSDMIREALNLNSSLIVVKERFGPGGGWIIYGGGLGHGVGFSQCGAIGLTAKKGANYKQLLNYYFEGLRLGRRAITRERTGA
ncbi:MAG: SpoIID/LytB domain-containing protein [Candidatus Omnitrophica bacterium]|nr:SpoIID/LytB domain-containing protein [Candidatus Omnitrophota bacterium]